MKSISNKTAIKLILFLLYAVITLIAVLHHEIWADEAQVWMLVKYLNVPELLKHLVNEGHPSLFYLINMPFAKLGFSAFVMQLICWGMSCASVFLLLQYSPFNRFTKFAIITSAGFLYFFPIIARSYSILPFFVFLAAILYPKSKEKPFLYAITLAIIANTHVIMFGFAAVLAMFFIYDNVIKDFKNASKSIFASAAIMLLGLLAVYLQLHGTTESNIFINIDFSNLLVNIVKVLGLFFINAYDTQFPLTHTVMFKFFGIPAILLSIALYITFFYTLYSNNKKLFTIAFLSIVFQLIIYIIGYNNWIFVNRIFCAHIIMIFCFWVMLKNPDFKPSKPFLNKKFINATLAVFFILTALNGVKYYILDLKQNYSGAKEAAAFIEKNIDPKNSILLTDNEPHTIALAYYLDGKFNIYSALNEKNIKYLIWNKTLYHVFDSRGWSEYVLHKQKQNPDFRTKKIYAIFSFFNTYQLGIEAPQKYKLIFTTKPSVVKLEGYKIYEYVGQDK